MNKIVGSGLSRRQMIAGTVIAGMAAAEPAWTAQFFSAKQAQLGVQLYAVSEAMSKDVDATFARLAAMGCRTLETAGFHARRPQELKRAADRAGLEIVSTHVQAQIRFSEGDRLLTDPDVGALAADLHVLGVKQVVMPLVLLPNGAVPPKDEHFRATLIRLVAAYTVSDWQRTADFLNQRGAALRREGLALSYHNHNMEFAPVDGTTGWEVLMRETDPALVGFELDVGWAAAAGHDPTTLLRDNPGRVRMLHLKDVDPATVPNFVGEQISAPLGRGLVHWPVLLREARAQGVFGYFVEQEPSSATSAFDAMAESIAYLRRIG